jgi:hypothetical protein
LKIGNGWQNTASDVIAPLAGTYLLILGCNNLAFGNQGRVEQNVWSRCMTNIMMCMTRDACWMGYSWVYGLGG